MQDFSLAQLVPLADYRDGLRACELAWMDDQLLLAVARVAGHGIYDSKLSPFSNNWADGSPASVARRVLQHQWQLRGEYLQACLDYGSSADSSGANLSSRLPEDFDIPFAVLYEGQAVGVQNLRAKGWHTRRTTETGSWVGLPFHGLGIGTAARILVAKLAFDVLGADAMETEAFSDNAASRRVTEKLGYQQVGQRCPDDYGGRIMYEYRLDRHTWLEKRESLLD